MDKRRRKGVNPGCHRKSIRTDVIITRDTHEERGAGDDDPIHGQADAFAADLF